jgi:NitT/TauT family transport system permease protein
MTRSQIILARFALLALVLGLWQVLPSRGVINPLLLPPLGDVLSMLGTLLGQSRVHEAIATTALEVLVAFIIAVPVGATLGVIIAESPYLTAIFKPILFYVFAVPKSIFLPLFILVFGIGFPQKVAYAAFTTGFVVLMSAMAAVESVKGDHILVARSYGATRGQILARIYIPSMMPILLETIRIAMIGIGHLIAGWGENFQMRQLFAGVILLATTAILFNEIVRFFEARCSTWRT